MSQPTLRDDIAATIARETSLPAGDVYRLTDQIIGGIAGTDRLIDQGKVYPVIETSLEDLEDECKGYKVYTATEPEPLA